MCHLYLRIQALIALITFNSATSAICLHYGPCGQSALLLLHNHLHAYITQFNKITLSIEEVFRCLLYTKGYFQYHYTMKNECAGDGITYMEKLTPNVSSR